MQAAARRSTSSLTLAAAACVALAGHALVTLAAAALTAAAACVTLAGPALCVLATAAVALSIVPAPCNHSPPPPPLLRPPLAAARVAAAPPSPSGSRGRTPPRPPLPRRGSSPEFASPRAPGTPNPVHRLPSSSRGSPSPFAVVFLHASHSRAAAFAPPPPPPVAVAGNACARARRRRGRGRLAGLELSRVAAARPIGPEGDLGRRSRGPAVDHPRGPGPR
uniref:Uncharacterized protein n=1 Tax=Oryza glaberrima TaxID=4538 RepID=A0A679BA20_ORYGL|nr:hypothetical protein [Oryza glaberrima]